MRGSMCVDISMKFFADTADIGEIRDLAATGLLDGVTTNPSLVAKTGRDFFDVLGDICAAVEGPVSAEVAALDFDAMVTEGRRLADVAECPDELALRVELIDRVLRVLDQVAEAVRADVDAVGPLGEHALSPGFQKVAIPVEDDHGMPSPIEEVHVVRGVHGHTGYIHQGPAFRELLPTLHGLENQVSAAQCHGHVGITSLTLLTVSQSHQPFPASGPPSG